MSLIDLDEMLLLCRNRQARESMTEAVACYRAGAFRACIVATWIAVVHDFLQKLRDLELTGDQNARKHLKDFEALRVAHDVRKSLEFERSVLRTARDEFGLLSPVQFTDLERLQEDRHRCAHPTMLGPEEPFQASAELARYHLHSAVHHFLRHPPVQGKAALEHILSDVESRYFPTDVDLAVTHLRAGLLARASEPLFRNLVVVLLKGLLLEDPGVDKADRRLAALLAFYKIDMAKCEAALADTIASMASNVPDDGWGRVIRIVSSLSVGWLSLGDPGRMKCREFILQGPGELVSRAIAFAFDVAELAGAASERLQTLQIEEVSTAIRVRPRAELTARAIELFSQAGSYRSAEYMGRVLMRPILSYSTPDDVMAILAATSSNGQIYLANGSPELVEALFDETTSHLPVTGEAWKQFLTEMLTHRTEEGYYSYPGVRSRLEEHELWLP